MICCLCCRPAGAQAIRSERLRSRQMHHSASHSPRDVRRTVDLRSQPQRLTKRHSAVIFAPAVDQQRSIACCALKAPRKRGRVRPAAAAAAAAAAVRRLRQAGGGLTAGRPPPPPPPPLTLLHIQSTDHLTIIPLPPPPPPCRRSAHTDGELKMLGAIASRQGHDIAQERVGLSLARARLFSRHFLLARALCSLSALSSLSSLAHQAGQKRTGMSK